MEVHPSVRAYLRRAPSEKGLPKCDFEFEIWGYPKDLKHLKIPWRKSWSTPPFSLLWSGFHHIYSNLMSPFLWTQCLTRVFFSNGFLAPKTSFLQQKSIPERCRWVKATWRFRWKHIVETIVILWSTHVPVPRLVVVGKSTRGCRACCFPPPPRQVNFRVFIAGLIFRESIGNPMAGNTFWWGWLISHKEWVGISGHRIHLLCWAIELQVRIDFETYT